MKIAFFFIVVSFCCSACISKKIPNQPQPFDWITGSWKSVDADGVTTEYWTKRDSVFSGVSYSGKTEKLLKKFETVDLSKKGRSYFYTVTDANDGSIVPFEITKYTRNSFVAENAKHDFPKRIGYELITKDSIVAFIDDGLENSKKRYYFYLNRMKK